MIIAAIAVAIAFGLALFGLKYIPLDGTRNDQVRQEYRETLERIEAHRENLAA